MSSGPVCGTRRSKNQPRSHVIFLISWPRSEGRRRGGGERGAGSRWCCGHRTHRGYRLCLARAPGRGGAVRCARSRCPQSRRSGRAREAVGERVQSGFRLLGVPWPSASRRRSERRNRWPDPHGSRSATESTAAMAATHRAGRKVDAAARATHSCNRREQFRGPLQSIRSPPCAHSSAGRADRAVQLATRRYRLAPRRRFPQAHSLAGPVATQNRCPRARSCLC